jgi:hypothetical protein
LSRGARRPIQLAGFPMTFPGSSPATTAAWHASSKRLHVPELNRQME